MKEMKYRIIESPESIHIEALVSYKEKRWFRKHVAKEEWVSYKSRMGFFHDNMTGFPVGPTKTFSSIKEAKAFIKLLERGTIIHEKKTVQPPKLNLPGIDPLVGRR
jgi:hypothetical protein